MAIDATENATRESARKFTLYVCDECGTLSAEKFDRCRSCETYHGQVTTVVLETVSVTTKPRS
jgi:predicted ATP-dependent serine protease